MTGPAGNERDDQDLSLPGGGVMREHASEPDEGVDLPVSFASLVQPFYLMALTGLGMIPHPESHQPEIKLTVARSAIALIELLKQRTEGQRSAEETRLIDEILGALKLHYVEVRGRSGRA
ncbi:MAG: DUF1844 domain-containing protein [Acidobacteriota bacterium]